MIREQHAAHRSKLYAAGPDGFINCSSKLGQIWIISWNRQGPRHAARALNRGILGECPDLSWLEANGHALPAFVKQHAQDLEKSYLDSRYPEVSLTLGPKDKYDKKSTTEARDKAKEILDFVINEKEGLMKGGAAAKTP